jgi:N-acetylmuramoyl-L-alanine amidase
VRSTVQSIASSRSVHSRAIEAGSVFSLALVSVFLFSGIGHARVHHSRGWADTQYAKAEAQRQTLNGRAEQDRTRREYETVIASYRRIVMEAPTSSKADGSAFAVAEVTAEMGRHFKDDMALSAAVREYKFLRREYPGSKHRIEALLAIGEIYKNDLGDESDARVTLEELVRRYPHSDLVKEAKAELAGLEASTDDVRESKSSLARRAEEESGVSKQRIAEHRSPSPDLVPGSSDKDARVTDVQYWSGPDYTRIIVSLEQDVQFEARRIDNPERIFFDLKNARVSTTLLGQSYDVDDGLIKKIRVAQYKPGRARVVVETAAHASYNASFVLNPPRLVIDVHADDLHADDAHADAGRASTSVLASQADNQTGKRADRDSHGSKPASRGESDEGSASSAEDPDTIDASPTKPAISVKNVAGVKKVVVEADNDDHQPTAAADPPRVISKPTKSARLSSRRVATAKMREAQPTSSGDRSLIRTLGLRIGKIVIDPGHGGHDTGTIGPNGLYEKDLVLDVSKRLGKLLEARLGADVVFTRRDDNFIPLETRTSIANQEQADLFVSVHANSSHDPDARGVETYYLNFTSAPDALEVAARENADSDKSIHELQDLVKKIALKEKIEESREFAADVQQSLHSGLAAKSSGMRDRGVKKAPFVVLIGANMPSILAEISFISNPGDEKRLRSAEYRQRIAESLYRGISRYVNGLGGVKVASRLEKASAN